MALLQILDPGAKPKPIGIDLGTTHSLVAYVTATGEPVTLADCDNETLVPSAVRYAPDGSVVVGKQALDAAAHAPAETFLSIKRFMGRGSADVAKEPHPYKLVGTDGAPRFEVGAGRAVTPVEVSAEILRELRNRALDELGGVGGAVITVPAYFDDAQRQATKDAGKLAGLDVLRLLNEPTAAALAYGLDAKKNGTFVVYDLGGGTFDVTVLVLDDGVFQVKSTGGDSHLGGDDMDRALAELLAGDAAANLTTDSRRALELAARQVKHALSERDNVNADIELPGGARVTRTVSRTDFEQAIAPLLDRTLKAARRALRDAKLGAADVDGVILVGGATRTPAVRRAVAELFGKEPLTSIDPDRVVALGAAVQADILAGETGRDDVLLLDVLPLSLGVETMGGVVERILPRNTPIPAAAAQVFTTYADQQTGFELHVVQGERELAADCRSLAKFTLRGIPPMSAGMARLEVRFEVDANGILHVSAKEQRTGIEQSVDVEPTYGLGDDEIERMLLDAYEHGEDDVKKRALTEQRVEAARILDATRAALRTDATLLEPGERELIDKHVVALEMAAAGEDHHAVARAIESLDHAIKPFAGRRMDRAFREALRGRDLGGLESETAHAKGIESHLPQGERDGRTQVEK